MLKNAYVDAKIGVDSAENEPSEVPGAPGGEEDPGHKHLRQRLRRQAPALGPSVGSNFSKIFTNFCI